MKKLLAIFEMKRAKLCFISFFTLTSSFFTLNAQTGVITSIAGTGVANYNGDNRQATTAEVNNPSGVAVDAAGNVYIADQVNNRIRKISTTGNITTIAGTGRSGYSGNGGQATAAEIAAPNCVRVDSLGNVYFSDAGNALIRKISTTGIITNLAGIPGDGGYSGNGGQATAAELNYPVGIGLDKNLNVYIADQNNNVIRKIMVSTHIITTFAGDNIAGFSGNGGQATAARLNGPTGVTVSNSGVVYIADLNNNEVRAVSTTGVISDFAGTGVAGYSGDGGIATATEIYNPTGVSTDAAGNVYISDAGNSLIWEALISTNRMYSIAGIAQFNGYSGDGGSALDAEINYPFDVIPDKNNNVYIADLNNNRVRKVIAACTIDTTTTAVYNYPGCNGNTDGIVVAFSNSPFQPYIYSWSAGGNTNQEVTGLSAGIYTVTIRDAIGCSATSTVTLTQPTAVIAKATVISNVNCFGSRDGSISASASGGESPYNYSWTPTGGNAAIASGLSAGIYTVTVADYTGCTATASATITQPATLPAITISNQTNISCFGGTGGVATANPANGGTSPYLYNWSSGGGSNLAASGLSAGIYVITATDNNGCTATANVTITQPANLSISILNQTNVSCFGGTGSATANAAMGGTSPYAYSWSSGGGTNLTISGLSPGIDTITVTDNNGCMVFAIATITQPTAVTALSTINSNVSCNGNSDGSASVTAGGGTGAFTYSWTPAGGNSATANGLAAGAYTVTVTDNNGCMITDSVTITQPALMTVTHDSVDQTSSPCNGIAAVTPGGGTAPYTYMWTTGGQTTDTITGQCTGTYCCEITDNNGCSLSTCVTVNLTTGINNISNSSSISIYPDPNTGQFTIAGVTQGQIIELYNYIGQMVSSIPVDNSTMHFNISDQPNGIYLIRILSKDGTPVNQKKIVKIQ